LKQNKEIPVLTPGMFVQEHFNKEYFAENNINLNLFTPKESSCYFVIGNIVDGMKMINFPKESHKITYYEVIFLTQGYCVVNENLIELNQCASQIRFSPPGKIVSVNKISDDVEGFYCLFDDEFINHFAGETNFLKSLSFFDLDAIPILTLSNEQITFFKTLLQRINNLYQDDYVQNKAVICSYFTSLLKECSLNYNKLIAEESKLSSAERISQGFIRLVNKYYLTKRDRTEYAQMLHITPKHLTKCVKQSTNQTPTDFIFQMLMLEAKVLLKETNLSIAEIAFSLSFDDDAYFNRFFKNISGMTPNNYRKSVKA